MLLYQAIGRIYKKVNVNTEVIMANLIKCPTCGKQISSNAISCPNCGEVINSKMSKPAGAINMKDPVHFVGVVISILVILGVIAVCVGSCIKRL